MRYSFRSCFLLIVCLGLQLNSAQAQFVNDRREDLAFDRPESWAMAYVASITRFSGFGVPQQAPAGKINFSLEGSYVPHLSPSQRQVGLLGNKAEDLNKSPVFGRIRAEIGLPWGLQGEIGFVPPIQVNGSQPNALWSLALSRQLWEGDQWRFGIRAYAQDGTINGDITCDEDTVAGGTDFEINPFGCLSRSDDELTVDYYGLELSTAYRLNPESPLELYLSLAVDRLDLEVQVDAETINGLEQSLLLTEGTVETYTVGGSYGFTEKISLSAEIYYNPLEVNRENQGLNGTDALLSVRTLLRYRW